MKKMSLLLCAIMAALVVSPVFAQRGKLTPTGTLTTTAGSQRGQLRWKNSTKEYTLTNEKGASFSFSQDDVSSVQVNKPAGYDEAVRKVQQGGAGVSAAIPTLKSIVEAYNHLTYDIEASRWLADAYMQQGNAAEAVKVCEEIIRGDATAAYKGAMAVSYWAALSKTGKSAQLKKYLEQAIGSGDSTSAAAALVARGNDIMARGSTAANCREALKDGYLRVILLYAEQKDSYAEALYMGAKAFDGMQQAARADKLRAQLKAECAGSTWARK